MSTFGFVVPLSWSGDPWADGSEPTSWLGLDGRAVAKETVLEDATSAPAPVPDRVARFTFKLQASMVESLKIEVALDDVNGGIEATVDLTNAMSQTYRRMRAAFEAEIWPVSDWPEGRPSPKNDEERKAQETLIDALFYADENATDRAALDRMGMIRDRQQVAAEWAVLIVNPPPGWESIADKPLRRGYAEAIATAYLRAKNEANAASGK